MVKYFLNFIFILFFALSAEAFQILSPRTEACHEKMILGVFGQGSAGFIGDGNPSNTNLYNLFVNRANQVGVPQDKATQGMLTEMTNRYSWHHLSEAERFILASFVAGLRNPDTLGFSIVDINQVRSVHVRNADQSSHSLRTSEEDEPSGASQAIQEAIAKLYQTFEKAQTQWNSGSAVIQGQRWTFAFYGEHGVSVFGPAYELGLVAHIIQDSYSHSLRDSNGRIVTVLNYVELMVGRHNERIDGPAHSDRMDRCNADNNSFDSMRVNEARVQVAQAFNAAYTILSSNLTDHSALQTVVNHVYDYQSGCSMDNEYCGSSWYEYAKSDISKPLLSSCGLVMPQDFSSRGPGNTQATIIFMLLMMPLLFGFSLRLSKRIA